MSASNKDSFGPPLTSMLADEKWREQCSDLAKSLRETAAEFGFDAKYNLLLNDLIGLLTRSSYRAGWDAAQAYGPERR